MLFKAPVRRSDSRLRGLDTLRAFAIAAVMPYHLQSYMPEALRPAAHFGWMGVDLFFVLSGYLIASQLFRPYLSGKAPRLRVFYVRRAYRILPAFAVVLLLYLFVPVWREAPGLSPWWEFVTFTENLFVDYSVNRAFSHVWSLCVEEHFYLVLPLLTILLMRRPAAWKVYTSIAGLVVAGMVLRGYILIHELRPLGEDFSALYIEKIYYPTYTRLDGLLAGVSLALVRTFRPVWWSALERRGHSLTLSGLLTGCLAGWILSFRFASTYGMGEVGTIFGLPLLSLGLALIVASALSNNGWLGRVRVPGAKTIAMLSFSLYLSHKGVVHVTNLMAPQLAGSPWLAQPVYMAACLAGAAAIYLAVERPFLAIRDRRGTRPVQQAIDVQVRTDPAL